MATSQPTGPPRSRRPTSTASRPSGRRFTSGYSTASTCTPTRYSFLTGSYAFRRKGTGIAPPNGHLVVPPDAVTVADLARTAGYRTAVIGKWHLGLGAEGKGPDWNGSIAPGPREIGFDYNFLLPTTNDRVPQVFVEGDRVVGLDPRDPLWVGDRIPSPDHPTGISHRDTLKLDWSHGHNGTIHNGISRIGFYTGGHAARFRDEDLADAWAAKADAWLEANRSQPFFLFLASHDLHVPRMPHERFQGKSGLGFRADSILQLDWQVGELMKSLDRLGLDRKNPDRPLLRQRTRHGRRLSRTPPSRNAARTAPPVRIGRKVQRLRGRHPHPLHHLLEGPHPPGVSDEVVSTIDLAASFAALTGTPLPDDACVDSVDVSGVLLGTPGARGRKELVQQDNGGSGNFGFRAGSWKLVRSDSRFAHNLVVEERLARTPVPPYQLFDLSQDPYESTDVLARHPEKGEELKARLAAIIAAGRSR
jgi:arylsulfatase A-like enzyme